MIQSESMGQVSCTVLRKLPARRGRDRSRDRREEHQGPCHGRHLQGRQGLRGRDSGTLGPRTRIVNNPGIEPAPEDGHMRLNCLSGSGALLLFCLLLPSDYVSALIKRVIDYSLIIKLAVKYIGITKHHPRKSNTCGERRVRALFKTPLAVLGTARAPIRSP